MVFSRPARLTHDPPRLPRVLTIEREDRRSIPFDLRSAEDLPLVSLQVSLNTRCARGVGTATEGSRGGGAEA